MRHTAAVLALAFAGMTVAGPAQAAPPDGSAGCQDFGTGVAGQAQLYGRDFGQRAKSVAAESRGPVFPEVVVREEKRNACST